jgi:hypothetical protein
LRTDSLARAAIAPLALVATVLVAAPATSLARHATPTPSPSPTPVADPAVTKIAMQQFVQWQAGSVNKSAYIPQVLPKLTDSLIATTSHALAQLGALTDTVYIGRWINPDFPPGVNGYIYQMRCALGNVYLWLAIDPQGKIDVFFKNRLDVENVTPAPSSTPSGAP